MWHLLHVKSLLIEQYFPECKTSEDSLALVLLVRCMFSSEEMFQVDSGAHVLHSPHLRAYLESHTDY